MGLHPRLGQGPLLSALGVGASSAGALCSHASRTAASDSKGSSAREETRRTEQGRQRGPQRGPALFLAVSCSCADGGCHHGRAAAGWPKVARNRRRSRRRDGGPEQSSTGASTAGVRGMPAWGQDRRRSLLRPRRAVAAEPPAAPPPRPPLPPPPPPPSPATTQVPTGMQSSP